MNRIEIQAKSKCSGDQAEHMVGHVEFLIGVAPHPRDNGKQKHEVTVEEVVRYELSCGCPREDLVPRIRRTWGMFSNVSQERVDRALEAVIGA